MRMVRVSVFIILAVALHFIGIAPRKISRGDRCAQDATGMRRASGGRATQAAQRPNVRVKSVNSSRCNTGRLQLG